MNAMTETGQRPIPDDPEGLVAEGRGVEPGRRSHARLLSGQMPSPAIGLPFRNQGSQDSNLDMLVGFVRVLPHPKGGRECRSEGSLEPALVAGAFSNYATPLWCSSLRAVLSGGR